MSLPMVRFRADSGTAEVRSHGVRVFASLRTVLPPGRAHTAGLPQAARPRDLIGRAVGAPVPAEPFTVGGSYDS